MIIKEAHEITLFTGTKSDSSKMYELVICKCGWSGSLEDLDSVEHLGEREEEV